MDMGVKFGFVQKSGAWFYLGEERLGQGRDAAKQYFKDHPEEAEALERWVQEGQHGSMSYLERNSDKRRNPAELVPGCKSIISVAMSYAQENFDETHLHISRYAQGSDYHKIVKDKLDLLLQSINSLHPVKGRPFCDSAPVMERYWAKQAGIGRIGKNHSMYSRRSLSSSSRTLQPFSGCLSSM